jgi:hypothetical protein
MIDMQNVTEGLELGEIKNKRWAFESRVVVTTLIIYLYFQLSHLTIRSTEITVTGREENSCQE